MARGFESKSVESQQEEAQRVKITRPALTPEEQARQTRKAGARAGPGPDPIRDVGGLPAGAPGNAEAQA